MRSEPVVALQPYELARAASPLKIAFTAATVERSALPHKKGLVAARLGHDTPAVAGKSSLRNLTNNRAGGRSAMEEPFA